MKKVLIVMKMIKKFCTPSRLQSDSSQYVNHPNAPAVRRQALRRCCVSCEVSMSAG